LLNALQEMDTEHIYRNNGAIGVLLDEYEKTIHELMFILDGLDFPQLTMEVYSDTKDEDCRSIQSILTHTVQSGFTYVIEIRKWLGEVVDYREKLVLGSIHEYKSALLEMFQFTERLFHDYPDLELTELNNSKKIKVRWGQSFDVEQLMQHAIVHVLRHRLQVEKYKLEIDYQLKKR